MRPILVKELAELLTAAIKNGHGDSVVLVSNDEECNGYHSLYRHNYGVSEAEDVRYYNEKTKQVEMKSSIILD